MADVNSIDNTRPRITVIGVGGAGGNAVNNMIRSNLEGVDFLVANTDAQALRESLAEKRLQIGGETTEGLGAGSKPEMGRLSAEEDIEEVMKSIKGSHMLFVTAGMGGGTGTGAAPVIAKAAREMGILTIGVVTKPFNFEGVHRMKTADRGIEDIQGCVDTLIVIPNQNLFRLATDKTTFADAFNMADNVLYSGVRGVTDLMIMPGLINLDFADVKSVMSEMGKAMMGTGEAEGDNRAIEAAESAISNPLLDDVSMRGAKGVLINITGGLDMTLFEVDEAANRIREEVDESANIIFGSTFDERMSGRLRVSVVATGIDAKPQIKNRGFGEQMSFIPKTPEPAETERAAPRFQGNVTVDIEAADGFSAPLGQHEIGEGIIVDGESAQPNLFKEPFEGGAAQPTKAPEPPRKKSFLEKLGLKKSRTPEAVPAGQSAQAPRADGRDAQAAYGAEQGQDSFGQDGSDSPYEQAFEDRPSEAPKPQDDLDIPAFLRAKQKK